MSSLYPRDLPLAATHSDCADFSHQSPSSQGCVEDQPGLAATLIAAAPIDPNESSGDAAFRGLCRVTLPLGSTAVFELRGSVDWAEGTIRLTGLPVEPKRDQDIEAPDLHANAQLRLAGRTPVPLTPLTPLTKREREVAGLLARGESNARIAELLRISPHTARRHTESVMLKLGVNARAQVGAILRDAWPLRIAG